MQDLLHTATLFLAQALALGLQALLWLALPAVWAAWWVCCVDWQRLHPLLKRGAWLTAILLIAMVAMIWSQIAPQEWLLSDTISVPNFWWQLAALTAMAVTALACGWLQGLLGLRPRELDGQLLAPGPSTPSASLNPARSQALEKRPPLWQLVRDFFWGYDFFISYHWVSGGEYAVNLAQRLRDRRYDVFLDRYEYAMSDDWIREGTRALRHTRRLVVIATQQAMTESPAVAREIEIFTQRNNSVILIVFGNRFTDADHERWPTLKRIPNSQLQIQEPPENLHKGASDPAVDALVTTHRILRRRTLRSLIVNVVIISLATAVIAVGALGIRTQLALEQEKIAHDKADAEARRSRSGELAAQSQLVRASQPQLATLLAAAAANVSISAAEHMTVEARQALYDSLLSCTGQGLGGHTTELRCLALCPDNKWAATGSADGRLRVFDLSLPTSTRKAEIPGALNLNISTLVFDSKGKWLTGHGDGGDARLWRVTEAGLDQGRLLGDAKSKWLCLGVAPSGDWLVATKLDNEVWRWSLSNAEPVSTAQRIGHKLHTVKDFVFSANSRWLAAWPLIGKTAWVWDFMQHDLSAHLNLNGPGGKISVAAMGGNRPLLALGDELGNIGIWDLGAPQPAYHALSPWSGKYAVETLQFSLDGAWLAATYIPRADASSAQHVVGVFHWSPDSKVERQVLILPERVQSLQFGPRDNRLYIGGDRGSLLMYDLKAADKVPEAVRLVRHNDAITHIAIAPGGDRLCTADLKGHIHLWNISCGDPNAWRVDLLGHESSVSGLAISSDSRWIVTCSSDGTARRWDCALPNPADSCTVYRSCESEIEAAAVESRGLALAVGAARGEIGWFDLTSPEPVRSRHTLAPLTPMKGIDSLNFLRDGSVMASTRGGPLRWWKPGDPVHDAGPIRLEGHKMKAFSLSVAADSKKMATADLNGTAWLWDLAPAGRLAPEKAQLSIPDKPVHRVALSPNGRWLTGEGYDTVSTWDLTKPTLPPARRLTAFDGPLRSLGFDLTGRWFVCVAEHKARLWEVPEDRNWPEPREVGLHQVLEDVAFSQDGRFLASTDIKGRFCLYPLEPRSAPLTPQVLAEVGGVAVFDPSGQRIASMTASEVRVWKLSELQVAPATYAHEGGYGFPMVFSQDGRWLAFADNHVTKLLEFDEHGIYGPITLQGHRGNVRLIGFSAGSRWLVTQSFDAVRVVPLRAPELLAGAIDRAGREFTDRERRIYFAR